MLIGDVLEVNSYIEGVQGGTDDGQLKPEEMGDVEIEGVEIEVVKVADARLKHEGVQIGCIQVDCRSEYCKLELRNYKLDLNCTGSSEDIWHEVCFVP